MVTHCTIVKKNNRIVLICNIDGHKYVTFNAVERNMILSGNPIKLHSCTVDISQQVWEKKYDQLVGG